MKKIAPAALVALKEALSLVYWYRRDFQSFITHVVREPSILSRVNWNEPKRNAAFLVVELLAREPDKYHAVLLRLMTEVANMDDFTHLEKLEDGKAKAEAAKQAVIALRKFIRPHEDEIHEQDKAKERRKASEEVVLHAQGVNEKLRELKVEFCNVVSSLEPQKRGFRLERILRELFALFDLDPKASFRIVGEQIDGAFTFDNTDYLLSAKWQQDLVGIEDLDAFGGKIGRKLENTLGLFISINGFSPNGIDAHCKSRPAMILMDGTDLIAVLEGRIRLDDLLLRKRRHAAQTGNIFLRIADILAGT